MSAQKALRHQDDEGHYAGFVSRLGAFVVDVCIIVLIFSVAGDVIEYLVNAVSDHHFTFSQIPIISIALLVVLSFAYCAYPLAMSGRTLGMTLLGLRVVRYDGSGLNAKHAIVRVLAFPLSILTLGIGLLLILLRRDRCALHDLIADTAVVYDWNLRQRGFHGLVEHRAETQKPLAR